MEQIKTIVSQNEQTPTSWKNQPNSTKTIPREQHAAIFTMINLYRGWLKWKMQTAKELDEEIKIWADAFNEYRIPIDQYLPLLKRARDLRITRLSNGLNCPDYNSELLIACWIGENGLQKELLNRRVEEGRTLSTNAESVCRHCHGSGFKTVKDGFYSGVVKCNHND